MSEQRITPQLGLLVGLLGVTGVVSAIGQGARAEGNVLPRSHESGARSASPAQRQQALEAFSHLPLAFEENAGQVEPGVRFLSRGNQFALELTGSEARFLLPAKDAHCASASVRMGLVGSNPAARLSGLELLPGKTNYLQGRDRSRWHTGINNFQRVRAAGVYPGIDLVYYGNQRELEYDFQVGAGSDPSQIRLSFRGARSASLSPAGDLVLNTAAGPFEQRKPVVYQMIEGKRKPVVASYALQPGTGDESIRVGFRLGSYDRQRPLVIDPKLTYCTYVGGVLDDAALGVAVDIYGNTYITGCTKSPKIPFGGAIKPGIQGQDGFVMKLNAAACSFIWATYLGGSKDECANAIAIDSDRNVYVTGYTDSLDFPVTVGAPQVTFQGGSADAFVTKINAAGNEIIYSTYLGGTKHDDGRGIAVDADGAAYVTGATGSLDFPVTGGAFQTVYGGGNPLGGGNSDAWVAKVNPAGTLLEYSTYLGGGPTIKSNGDDWGNAIAVDALGQACVTGATNSLDFPKLFPLQSRIEGFDAFVTKLTADGSGLLFSTYLGGAKYDEGFGIVCDTNQNIYVVGTTASNTFSSAPTPTQPFGGGDTDAFVAKLNPKATHVAYFTFIGGKLADTGRGIAIDSARNVWVTGATNIPNVTQKRTPHNGENQPSDSDAYAVKLSATGFKVLARWIIRGSKDDGGTAIAEDPYNNTYVVGTTLSTDLTKGIVKVFQDHLLGGMDGFAAKIPSTPGGQISVSPKRFRFHSTVGAPITRNLTIRNTGRVPLGCTLGPVTAPFKILYATTELVIQPGQTIVVPISFAAKTTAGTYQQILHVVNTSKGKKSCFEVNLLGIAQ